MRLSLSFLHTPPKISFAELILIGLTVLAVSIGWYARLSNLDFPQHFVFDESIYIPVARDFVAVKHHLHDHPALSSMLFALGLAEFDGTPLGWRLMPALMGLIAQISIPWAAYKLFKLRSAALIAAIWVAIDPMFAAYSRLVLPDLLIVVLQALALGYAWNKKPSPLVLGLILGLAAAVKMNGAFIIAPILILLMYRRQFVLALATLCCGALSYASVALLAELAMASPQPLQDALEWQKFSWHFHSTLIQEHPWGSRWYTWPLLLVPVRIYQYIDGLQTYYSIISLPNPPLLWLSTVSLLSAPFVFARTFWQKHRPSWTLPFSFLALAALINWLAWSQIERLSFWYHYFPSYTFLLIGMAGLLAHSWNKASARLQLLILIFLGLSVVSGIYFLPLGTASPLNQGQYQNRQLLESWQYPGKFLYKP